MILAIDFDHTIHDTDNPPPHKKMGPPMPHAKEALTFLKSQGHTIIIHCLWGTPNKVKTISDWLTYFNIPYDQITNIKPDANLYIDDKGYHFQSWQETLNYLNNEL